MTDMLEKIARGIETAHVECARRSGNPIEGGEDYDAIARAALLAMREPGDWAHEFDGSGTAPTVFTAIIDAILAGSK